MMIQVTRPAKCTKLEATTFTQSQDIDSLKLQNCKLATKLEQFTEKTIYLESQSRRSNLIFYGLSESTPDDCEHKVRHLIKVHLGLKELFYPNADEGSSEPRDRLTNLLRFERCHRLGQKRKDDTEPRPIIVKFTYFKTVRPSGKNVNYFVRKVSR